MTLKIYAVPPSPFSRKVVVILEEKGMDYEYVEFPPFPKREELTKKSPLGLIPILEHDGRIVNDSSVICAYIEQIHPSNPVYPKSSGDLANVLFLEEYADTALMNAIAPIFRERFVRPNAFGEDGDDEIVRNAVDNDLPPVLNYIESRLSDGVTIGDSFSVADAAIGNVLTCLNLANEELDSGRWPKLAAYHQALLARPSFEKALPVPG